MVTRVRFAPSPTGTLHVGNALSAVANRAFGDRLLLRIDDTDPARNLPGGEEAIVADLGWLGIVWDEGPVRQSDRAGRHLQAARDAGLDQVFHGVPLWRTDGTPTFHLASVVDDLDFAITHVIRGSEIGEAGAAIARQWRDAGDKSRAIDYLVVAAEQSERGWAKERAVDFYREALGLVAEEDGERRVAIKRRLAVAHQAVYHLEDARLLGLGGGEGGG